MKRLVLAVLLCACAGARPAKDETSLLKGAQDELAAGHAEAAQRGFEGVLARDARSLAAIRGRIEAARKRGALPVVLREAKDAVGARPSDAYAWYGLGLAAFAQGDEAAAVSALRKAAELRPDEADIQYRLGVALLDGEKYADAREPLQKAVQLAPKVARYRAPLAACLGRLGDPRAGLAALRDVPRLEPTADEAATAVKTARSLSDPFRGVSPDARTELEQALALLGRDAPGLAIAPLETLLQKMPDLAPAHAVLGLAVARLDETGRAIAELHRAAELAPDLPQPHAWLAEIYAGKDRGDLAAQEYALALERNPLDQESLQRLGALRLAKGLPGALETLTEASTLSPDDEPLQLLVARAELAAGKIGAARPRLERLAASRPEDPEVLLRLAMLLFDERVRADDRAREQLTQRVETLLTKVLTLQPENATANRLLAAIRAG